MKRFLFALCILLCFTVASAQTDSIRKGKKDPNKSEKPVNATAKPEMPRDNTAVKRGNNRRRSQSHTVPRNNSTDPKDNRPPVTPASPAMPSNPVMPANPDPTSPTGQP